MAELGCNWAENMIRYAHFRPLAQLVEHGTFNAGVAGPIPARPTILGSVAHAADPSFLLHYPYG